MIYYAHECILHGIFICILYRIRQAIKDQMEVVDVDGSYLYKKCKRLEDQGAIVMPLVLPSAPVAGWDSLTEVNASELAKKVPHGTAGEIYLYLSSHAGREQSEGTFCALTGDTHTGHLVELIILKLMSRTQNTHSIKHEAINEAR